MIHPILHVCILSAVLALCSIGCGNSQNNLPRGIYATPSVCDLGGVVDTETITGDFKIVNATDRTIKIVDVILSCGCADIKLSEDVIPPESSIDAKLTVDLEGKYGPQSFSVMLHTNSPADPIIPLRLNANIAAKKLDGTIMFELGQFFPEEKIDQSFNTLPGEVTNVSVTDIQYSELFSADPFFDISATPSENQDVNMQVQGIAPAQSGVFTINVKLSGEGSDWGEAEIVFQGTVQPEISLPLTVSLGFIEPNQTGKTVVDIIGVESFLSDNTIEKMTVLNTLSDYLHIELMDSSEPKLEFSLDHAGKAETFNEQAEMEFIFSNGKKIRLSAGVAARFL